MRLVSHIILAVCFVANFASDAASELRDIDAIQHSVVRLAVVYADGTSGTGTGFFVNEKCHIATAYHVVQDAISIRALKYDKSLESGYGGWATNGDRVDPSRIIVEGYSPHLDLALISFDDITDCRPLPISAPRSDIDGAFPVDILTPIAQFGLKGLTVENYARKIQTLDDLFPGRTVFSDEVLDLSVHVLSGEIINGMSGSPVIYEGEVLGLVSGSREQGGDFGWAIPIRYLSEIKRIGRNLDKIRSWPKLTLLHESANKQLRLGARRPNSNSARVLYSPVVFGTDAALEVQIGDLPLEILQIGPKEASGPIEVATHYSLPIKENGVSRFPYRAVLPNGVIKQGDIHLLSIDPDLLGSRADEWRALAVGVAARHGDFSTAFKFLYATADPRWVAEAHANFCWVLLVDNRPAECHDLVTAIEMHPVADKVITKLVGWTLFQRAWANRLDLASQIAKLARHAETRDELLGDIAKAATEKEISHDSKTASDASDSIERETIASETRLDLARRNFRDNNLSKSLNYALNAFTSSPSEIQSKIDLLIRLANGLIKSQRRGLAEQATTAAHETVMGAYAPYSRERLHYLIRLADFSKRHDFDEMMLQVINEFDRFTTLERPVTLEKIEEFEQAIVSMMSFWSHKSQPDQAINIFNLLELPKYRLFGLTISGLSAVKSFSPNTASRFIELIASERNLHRANHQRPRIGNIHSIEPNFTTAGDSSPSWHFLWLGPEHSQYDRAKLDLFLDLSSDPFETALASIALEQWLIGDVEGAVSTLVGTDIEINSALFIRNALDRLKKPSNGTITRSEFRRAFELIRSSDSLEAQFRYLNRLKQIAAPSERSLIERRLSLLSVDLLKLARDDVNYINRHLLVLASAVVHGGNSNELRAMLTTLRNQLNLELLAVKTMEVDAESTVSSYAELISLCRTEQFIGVCTDDDFDLLVAIAYHDRVKRFFSGAEIAGDYLFSKDRFDELAYIIMLDYFGMGGVMVNSYSDKLIREKRFQDLMSLRNALSALAQKPGPSNAKAMTDRIDMRIASLPDYLSFEDRLNLVVELMPSQSKDKLFIELAKRAETFDAAITLTSKIEQADILSDDIIKALKYNARTNQESAINYITNLESSNEDLSFLVITALLDFVDKGGPEILTDNIK